MVHVLIVCRSPTVRNGQTVCSGLFSLDSKLDSDKRRKIINDAGGVQNPLAVPSHHYD